MRYTYDNNYFNDRFQGIPCGGYTRMIERMLEGCEIRCGVDYLAAREHYRSLADQVVYTGMIDEYFGFSLGRLAYRSLRFEDERYEEANRQGVAVMNYTDRETPYTRTIEHKHFQFGQQPHTIVTREYPVEWKPGLEPYYPVNDEKNQRLYEKYADGRPGEGRSVLRPACGIPLLRYGPRGKVRPGPCAKGAELKIQEKRCGSVEEDSFRCSTRL